MGSAGQVTAYADGAEGYAAVFDFGDASAAVNVPATPEVTPEADHTYAANGTFTISVDAAEQTATTDVTISDIVVEDPGALTVAEVQSYVTAHPEAAQAVRDAEAAGKARATLLTWLDGVLGA